MATLTRTRALIDERKEHISDASRASFMSVVDAFEQGRFGRDDAMLQLRLATLGPAATADPKHMNDIIACFESETGA